MMDKGGTLINTQVTPTPNNFSAYAMQLANGTTDVILTNKDPNYSITVNVARPGVHLRSHLFADDRALSHVDQVLNWRAVQSI